MSDASVLKRKLAPPLAKALADCAVETHLRKTMPRDADRLCGLDLVVDDVSFTRTDKASVIEELGEAELVYQMENATGTGGLCILSHELLAGLIEIQLYGVVMGNATQERKPTRTDGIVAAGLVDAWLESAERTAGREKMAPMFYAGFARKDGVLDQRNAAFLIEPGEYSKMTITMTLGDAAKTGTLRLVLPEARQVDAQEARLAKRMECHLAKLEAPMRAVLSRLPLAMERARGMKLDDVIQVPVAALASVKLEGVDGTPIATGRLGQMNGFRAVRLNSEGRPSQVTALAAPDETRAGLPPDMAELAATPEMTSEPDVGDLPDMPGLSDLPGEGGLPDLPDIDALPDLPAADTGELPGLPDIGDLPDLP